MFTRLLEVFYRLLFLSYLIVLVVGVLAVALLAVTGSTTVRGFSIAVFNLLSLVVLAFALLGSIGTVLDRVKAVRAILSEGSLTRRQILKLAGHTTALLIWLLGLPIVLFVGYVIVGSIVQHGITVSAPGYYFVCEVFYLCS